MFLIRNCAVFLNSTCLEVCSSQQWKGQNWFSCLLYVPKYHKVQFSCYHICCAICQICRKGLVAEQSEHCKCWLHWGRLGVVSSFRAAAMCTGLFRVMDAASVGCTLVL